MSEKRNLYSDFDCKGCIKESSYDCDECINGSNYEALEGEKEIVSDSQYTNALKEAMESKSVPYIPLKLWVNL